MNGATCVTAVLSFSHRLNYI